MSYTTNLLLVSSSWNTNAQPLAFHDHHVILSGVNPFFRNPGSFGPQQHRSCFCSPPPPPPLSILAWSRQRRKSLCRFRLRGPGLLNHHRRPNDDKDLDNGFSLESILDQVSVQFVKRPTPGIPQLPLGYLILLMSSTLFLPLSTALIFAAFFAFFSYLGYQLLPDADDDDDDDVLFFDSENVERDGMKYSDDKELDSDRPNTNLLALGAAIASTGLLAPIPPVQLDATPVVNDRSTFFPASLDTTVIIVVILTLASLIGTIWFPQTSMKRNINAPSSFPDQQEEEDLLFAERELMNRWDGQLEREERQKKGTTKE